MKRILGALVGLLSIVLGALPALACATCSLQTPRLVERYGLAFAVLLAAPFVIAAFVGGLILRYSRGRELKPGRQSG